MSPSDPRNGPHALSVQSSRFILHPTQKALLPHAELDAITRDLAARIGAQAVALALCAPGDRPSSGSPSEHRDNAGHIADCHVTPLDALAFVEQVIDSGATLCAPIVAEDEFLSTRAEGARLSYVVAAAVGPPGGPRGALCAAFAEAPSPEARERSAWVVERYAGLAALCISDPGVLDGLGGGRRDGLTGALNHTAVRAELVREMERSERNGSPLSCCFVDLDAFKAINDTYGHPYGSEVLARVAQILQENIRTGDTLGRYGGDEFVVLLPDTRGGAAIQLAERLRLAVSDALADCDGNLDASVGVAQSFPGASADQLLAAADVALLSAKRAGGGCVTSVRAHWPALALIPPE